MTTRAKVAVLRTQPETVLQDYERLLELAEVRQTLDRTRPPFSKTTSPGTIRCLAPTPLPGNWRARCWPCARPVSLT